VECDGVENRKRRHVFPLGGVSKDGCYMLELDDIQDRLSIETKENGENGEGGDNDT